ncbi:unnamed protein product [Hymenolepis diminuta]|uniref:Uncharacterized protein n=1 Tax=Hymenolepis diminuta TaxID=6216 RepID=A0A564ZCU7_HYMDI|nr:unnamed protein product [Hymenolepis diminuta]
MLWRDLTQVTHIKLLLFFQTTNTDTCQLLPPTLPAHLLSSSARSPLSIHLFLTRFKLVVASLNKFWSNQLLVFCCTIVVCSYSDSRELETVITVVICKPLVIILTPTNPLSLGSTNMNSLTKCGTNPEI